MPRYFPCTDGSKAAKRSLKDQYTLAQRLNKSKDFISHFIGFEKNTKSSRSNYIKLKKNTINAAEFFQEGHKVDHISALLPCGSLCHTESGRFKGVSL